MRPRPGRPAWPRGSRRSRRLSPGRARPRPRAGRRRLSDCRSRATRAQPRPGALRAGRRCRATRRSRRRRSRRSSRCLPRSRRVRPRRSAREPARAAQLRYRCSCEDLLELDDPGQPRRGLGIEGEVGPLAALLAVEQSRARELREMVARGRLAEAETLRDLACAQRLVALGDSVDDSHAGRVGERLEELRRGLGLTGVDGLGVERRAARDNRQRRFHTVIVSTYFDTSSDGYKARPTVIPTYTAASPTRTLPAA